MLEMMARETGLEPAASAVTGRRSNQLSYSRGCFNRSAWKRGLKGGATPSQGCCESPCQPGIFCVSMQIIPCLSAKQRSQRPPESFKACYVLGS